MLKLVEEYHSDVCFIMLYNIILAYMSSYYAYMYYYAGIFDRTLIVIQVFQVLIAIYFQN